MQLPLRLTTKVGDRLAFFVIISAQQDQLALDHVLCLKPELGRAALVETASCATTALEAFATASSAR
jgi:hypothetical protein